MTPEHFVSYMQRAFRVGYEGGNKDELIKSIIAELGPPETEDSEGDFRIYSLEELRSAPDGATFVSEPLGPFKIESYNGSKFGVFVASPVLAFVGLNCSSYPLDKGIRRVSNDEFQELIQEGENYTPQYGV